MRADLPVLSGRLNAAGNQVLVACPHCGRDHQHGTAGIADGTNMHRLAHCRDAASPYAKTGYVVALRRGHPTNNGGAA